MIEKKRAQWYASSSGVGLDIGEREIVLTYVLRLLYDGGLLDELAFKGGSAIRKVHLGRTGRFSLDLDFTAVAAREPEALVLELIDLLEDRTFQGISFTVVEGDYWTTGESCGAQVSYSHHWMERGRFAIEISCRSAPLMPVGWANLQREQYFDWMGVEPPPVQALDLREVIGEKIRAAAQRARVRDVYDLYQFADKPYDRAMVRLIAVIKCWETRYALDPGAFLEGLADRKYEWGDLARLVGADRRRAPDEVIGTVRDAYDFLKSLTAEEAQLAGDPYGRQVRLYNSMVEGLRSKAS
jgi:predicted nucleotidyltransferase component of viral defense system